MAFTPRVCRQHMVSCPSADDSSEYWESECAYDSSDTDIPSDPGDIEPTPKRRRTDNDFPDSTVKFPRLVDLAADVVAAEIPFKAVEHYHRTTKSVSESVLLEILRKAFPTDGDVVGLRASLSRSDFDVHSFRRESEDNHIVVKDATQTGLSLTGTLIHKHRHTKRRKIRKAVVSVLFDRRSITSATCSVHRRRVLWCKHIVRLVNHRISKPESVVYRLPISFTLERLSLTQMKSFLSSLFASSSSKLLYSASRAIDETSTAAVAKSTSCKPSGVPALAFDLTARGNGSDLCQWQFDEKRVRRVMKMSCGDFAFLRGGRSFTTDSDEPIYFGQWCLLLHHNQMRSRALVEKDSDGGVLTWRVEDELDSVFSVVEHLLKSGDSTVLKVLDVLTEQWLGMMEKVLRVVRRHLVVAGQTREDETALNAALYTDNKDLLLASGRAWFVPDRLTCYWRVAVLSPFYSNEDVEGLRARHIEWAIRVRRIVTEARRLRDFIDEDDEGWQELCTILSLTNWNGFCHVQALASPMPRILFKEMANPDADACSDDEMVEDTVDFLRTLSCFIQCLQFYGYGAVAVSVALKGIVSNLLGHEEESCLGDLATFSLSSIQRCHDEVGHHLWGNPDNDDDDESPGDFIPLASLLKVIINDAGAWKIRYRSPVTPASTDSESDEESHSHGLSSSSVPLPVYVLLKCFQKITADFRVGNASQLDVVVELNKLLVNLGDRLLTLCQHIQAIVFEAVRTNIVEAVEEPDSPVKLTFLLRFLLLNFGKAEAADLVDECLRVLASDLSERLGGEGLNEDFFLALTNYSSLIMQSLQFCLRHVYPINAIYSMISEAMNVDCSEAQESFFTRKRLHLLMDDVLQIAAIICTAIRVHVDIIGPLTHSLRERLKMLHLPSYFRVGGHQEDLKCSSRGDINDALIACKLLTCLLEISRHIQDDIVVSQKRVRALRGISELASVLDAVTVLGIVAEDDWYCVMSVTETVSNFLFEPTFVASFKSRKDQELSPAVEKVMRDVVLRPLYSFSCDDLVDQDAYYDAVQQLGLVPLMIQDVLANIPDTFRLSYRVLFRLSESLCTRPSEALPLALKAYTAMWNYSIGHNLVASRSPASVSSFLRGAHCLGAMAMQLDVVATPPGSVIEILSNIEQVLLAVMEMWVDPIISLHVVAEMARVRSGGKFPPNISLEFDMLHCFDCPPSQPSWSLASLSQVSRTVTLVLNRCKSSILAKLSEDVHLTWLPSTVGSGFYFKPKRRLLGEDFLCLATILNALPDPAIDMQAVLFHSETCLWQDAAMHYYTACRQGPDLFLPLNNYETYYSALICDEAWQKCLLAMASQTKTILG